MNRAQLEDAKRVLQENPPLGEGRLVRKQHIDGEWKDCFCGLGQLAIAAGAPVDLLYRIEDVGPDSSLEDYAALDPFIQPRFGICYFDYDVVHNANDSAGTPEERVALITASLDEFVERIERAALADCWENDGE